MKLTLFRENLRIALQTIRTNRLRTILTIAIIAFGIMALVGILTSIDSIKKSITDEFMIMGANTFSIESRGMNVHTPRKRIRARNFSFISYRQAEEFKENFKFPATVSIWTWASGMGVVKYGSVKTNPNIPVIGCDESYLATTGNNVQTGRNFSQNDILESRNYVILGDKIAKKLFGETADPLDKIIIVGSGKYKVVGVLEGRGSSVVMNTDNVCLIPYTNVRQYFSRPRMNYTISVKTENQALMDAAAGEAEGVFREVRNLGVTDESDFNINKSDSLIEVLLENLESVNIAAIIIGIITLFGAVVGLMNIMLVSVTERTREIGIRMALGARRSTIKQQFLYEAIVIGQFGGIFGIFLGILIGNVLSIFMKSSFIVPWAWILLGFALCFVVGVASGYFPAVKASRQDPIAALRYE